MWFPFSTIKQAILSTLLFTFNLRSVFVAAQEDPEAVLNALGFSHYVGPKYQQYQAIVQAHINSLNVTYPSQPL